jgi:hypothetical protein
MWFLKRNAYVRISGKYKVRTGEKYIACTFWNPNTGFLSGHDDDDNITVRWQ